MLKRQCSLKLCSLLLLLAVLAKPGQRQSLLLLTTAESLHCMITFFSYLQCLQTLDNGKVNYCVTLHPEKQNVLMTGASDKKIYQWDLDTGDVVQVRGCGLKEGAYLVRCDLDSSLNQHNKISQ